MFESELWYPVILSHPLLILNAAYMARILKFLLEWHGSFFSFHFFHEGLVSLEMNLAAEPVQGQWQISANVAGSKQSQKFIVKEYGESSLASSHAEFPVDETLFLLSLSGSCMAHIHWNPCVTHVSNSLEWVASLCRTSQVPDLWDPKYDPQLFRWRAWKLTPDEFNFLSAGRHCSVFWPIPFFCNTCHPVHRAVSLPPLRYRIHS